MNSLNGSLRETKSVSTPTSTSTPILPPAWMYESTAPSLVARALFFCAVARPDLRSSSIAFSRSPAVAVSAFLQSIMPAPLFSRSSFTSAAVISATARSFRRVGVVRRPGVTRPASRPRPWARRPSWRPASWRARPSRLASALAARPSWRPASPRPRASAFSALGLASALASGFSAFGAASALGSAFSAFGAGLGLGLRLLGLRRGLRLGLLGLGLGLRPRPSPQAWPPASWRPAWARRPSWAPRP